MSGVAVLVGLLVVVFLGSVFASSRSMRGFSSGAGYLVAGFVLGRYGLGVFERDLVQPFEPIFVAAVGWIGLVAGVSYFRGSGRRMPIGRAVSGTLAALLVAAAVAAASYFALLHLAHRPRFECLVLGLALAAALAEAGHHVTSYVGDSAGVSGPVQTMVTEMGQASAIVPVALAVVLFCLAAGTSVEPAAGSMQLLASSVAHPLARISLPLRCLVAPGMGLVLGITTALLLGREFRRDESWGILLGTSLLGIGASERLGVSAIGMTFAMGLALSASRHGADIQAMVAPTERPVFLPVALMAGLYLSLKLPPVLLLAMGAALVAKVFARPLAGVFFASEPAARPALFELGGGLLATGSLTLAIGFGVRLRYPGPLGDAVLLGACATAVVGELIAATLLRRALTRVGEIDEPEPSTQDLPEIPAAPAAPQGLEADGVESAR